MVYTLNQPQLPAAARTADEAGQRGRRPWISGNVLALGFTSCLTDISSESVSAVLPLYLVFQLGFAPVAFGFIDGLYQGATALLRIVGGYVADRSQQHKQIAALGYLLSAVCKLGLIAAGGTWALLSTVILVDRTGKGIRTAPRDALISLSSAPDRLGIAFGVHRALDTVGAFLGPLLAFAILSALPNAFNSVFLVSFCAALVGLGVLVCFVGNAPRRPAGRAREPVSLRSATRLLARRRFLALLVLGGLLGVATISDGFLYLVIQRRLAFNLSFFPLLYVGTALAYLALAIPAGWLADRIGRAWVFVGGYLLLLVVYTALLRHAFGRADVVLYLGCFGAYYAATDGVLMALASPLIPAALRASGLALVTTVTSVAALLGSVLFGAMWTIWGTQTAIGVLFAALLAAVVLAAVVLLPGQDRIGREQAPAA